MQQVMGPLPAGSRRCALDLQVIDETDAGTFVRRRIVYTSEPGSRVDAFLLLPKDSGKHPLCLRCIKRTRSARKSLSPRGTALNDEYGVELATRGYVVLAPPYPLLADYHPDLKKLGYVSGTMKAVWDNIRALDVLESLPT
jgi:hypothetical protein